MPKRDRLRQRRDGRLVDSDHYNFGQARIERRSAQRGKSRIEELALERSGEIETATRQSRDDGQRQSNPHAACLQWLGSPASA
jgi:hypothetical protein